MRIRTERADQGFSPFSRLPSWLRDTVAVAFVIGPSLAPHDFGGTATSSPLIILLVTIAAGSVLLRRRAPLIGVSLALGAYVLGIASDGPVFAFLVAVLVGIFGVARWRTRPTSLAFSGVTAGILATAAAIFLASPWNDARALLQLVVLVGFATAIGDASRSRAAYLQSLLDRARRAEESKESEALRRVTEERLRIARDLHDMLAHEIAVINLHSSVASRALPNRPEDAEKSLATIREAARTVLGEMGSLLNMLRTRDSDEPGPHTAPVAGLDDLESLLINFERNGLRIKRRIIGTPRPLSGAIDMTAFRVVQEALTNATKHGSEHSALLLLNFQLDGVEITVTNPASVQGTSHSVDSVDAPESRAGHGLLGLQERINLVSGRLGTAQGPGPVFTLTAFLPTATAAAAAAAAEPHGAP